MSSNPTAASTPSRDGQYSSCILVAPTGPSTISTVYYNNNGFYSDQLGTSDTGTSMQSGFSCDVAPVISNSPVTQYVFPNGGARSVDTYVVSYVSSSGWSSWSATSSKVTPKQSANDGLTATDTMTTAPGATANSSPTPILSSATPSGMTSDSTPTGSPGQSKGKFDSGAVAGAAVGSAIGAAILAALITLLCLRRCRNGRKMSDGRGSASDIVVFGKSGSPQHSPDESGQLPGSLAWMKQMPQSADDSTIAMRIKTLYNNIELHAENFYQDVDVRGSEMMEDAQEALLDLDSGLLPSPLSTTILHLPSKVSVIKHTLSHLILKNITTQDVPKNSFLPDEYVGLIQRLDKDQAASSRPAFTQSLSHYRLMTSYLRPEPTTDQAYLIQRDSKISRAATAFTTAFEAWSNHRASSIMTRKQNLIEIMRNATDTGIFLFSQPAAFGFRWEPERRQSEQQQQIVTLPSFVKVSDDRGNKVHGNGVVVAQVVQEI